VFVAVVPSVFVAPVEVRFCHAEYVHLIDVRSVAELRSRNEVVGGADPVHILKKDSSGIIGFVINQITPWEVQYRVDVDWFV
jgi:hypothetical protein